MPFTFKLARRLARIRGIVVLGATLAAACEQPVSTASDASVTSVFVSPAAITLDPSGQKQFAAYGRTGVGDSVAIAVAWSASGGAISTTGLYTAGSSAGSYRVVARVATTGLADTSTVTVASPPAAPVASVTVSPATASVTVGQTTQLAATPRDAGGNALSGRTITWTSGNTGVATVNSNGVVTAVAAGSATISATSEGKSGTATVTVTVVPVASVTVSPATASVMVGQTAQLTATPRDANGNPLSGRVVTWTTSALNVATVSGTGLVSGLLAGTVTITATSEGRSGSATVTITVVSGGLWPNEPSGMTLVSDEPFNALTESGWSAVQRQTTNGSGLSVTSDPTAPASPSSVLTFKYATGYQAGSEPGAEFFPIGPPVTETFVGFWWKASNPWQFHPSGVNKIAFMFTSVDNIYIMMYNDGAGPTIQVEPQLANDVRRLAPNVTATVVTLGVWHRIEWYVKQATTGTSKDGVVRWWVDGVLQGEYTDLQTSVNSGFIEYTIAPTWGGIGGTKTQTDYYWYDQYHISRR